LYESEPVSQKAGFILLHKSKNDPFLDHKKLFLVCQITTQKSIVSKTLSLFFKAFWQLTVESSV